MTLRIPLLAAHPKFRNVCRNLGLYAHPADQDDLVDMANIIRLGQSEVELMNKVIDGCAKLVSMEQALERGDHDMVDADDLNRTLLLSSTAISIPAASPAARIKWSTMQGR